MSRRFRSVVASALLLVPLSVGASAEAQPPQSPNVEHVATTPTAPAPASRRLDLPASPPAAIPAPLPATRMQALRQKISAPFRSMGNSIGNQLGIGAGHEGVAPGTSSPLQRALVAGQTAATGLAVHSLSLGGDWKAAAAAGLVYTGYQAADLAGGVAHWALDNYGDEHTPFFGTQIHDFQTHHDHPVLAGRRSIPDLMAPLTLVMTPAMLAIAQLPTDWWSVKAALIGFAGGLVLNPIGHKFAHKADVGPVVKALRKTGVFIEPNDHLLGHHLAPFDKDYGVGSGMSNAVANKVGLYRKLEAAVYKTTGAVPNTWKEPGGRTVMAEALGPDKSKHPDVGPEDPVAEAAAQRAKALRDRAKARSR